MRPTAERRDRTNCCVSPRLLTRRQGIVACVLPDNFGARRAMLRLLVGGVLLIAGGVARVRPSDGLGGVRAAAVALGTLCLIVAAVLYALSELQRPRRRAGPVKERAAREWVWVACVTAVVVLLLVAQVLHP